jgi:hypothetical protein
MVAVEVVVDAQCLISMRGTGERILHIFLLKEELIHIYSNRDNWYRQCHCPAMWCNWFWLMEYQRETDTGKSWLKHPWQ